MQWKPDNAVQVGSKGLSALLRARCNAAIDRDVALGLMRIIAESGRRHIAFPARFLVFPSSLFHAGVRRLVR
jgi:hypothetical protein